MIFKNFPKQKGRDRLSSVVPVQKILFFVHGWMGRWPLAGLGKEMAGYLGMVRLGYASLNCIYVAGNIKFCIMLQYFPNNHQSTLPSAES